MKEKDKGTGLVKTPKRIIRYILDNIGYNDEKILVSKIIDPAMGDGNFLLEITERIILEGEKKNLGKSEILKIIEKNIYGWDINKNLINSAIVRINTLLEDSGYGINKYKGKNLKNENALILGNNEKYKNFFHFVVGNPPYIRVQNLSLENRQLIKENSHICGKGAMDIYIPFFEFGYNILKENGILGYITPNTLLKNKSAKLLRKFLLENTNIKTFIDFKEHQIFDATTYSLITILGKELPDNSNINLIISDEKLNISHNGNIDLNNQDINKWNLINSDNYKDINSIENNGIKLKDFAKINTGLATLADYVYMHKIINFDKSKETQTIITKNGEEFEIETSILKPIIKISTYKNNNENQKLFIIFPYKENIEEKKYNIINEDELINNFPLAYKYLLHNKKILLSRDKGKVNKVAWYAFGRSQGLKISNGVKIVTSNINKAPNFIEIKDNNTLFISGYIIELPNIYNGNRELIDNILQQLNSDKMHEYINNTSRDYKGGYKGYGKSFIENFGLILKK